MSAPIGILQVLHLVEPDLWLILHNAELTDAIIYMNLRIPDRVDRHKPLVVIPAVGAVDHTLMVRLNDAEILEGGTSRHHMGFIALRQLQCPPQRTLLKLARL